MGPARDGAGSARAGAPPEVRRHAGYTLVEALFVVCIGAIVAGVSLPQLQAGIDQARVRGAARYLAARVGAARVEAVAGGAAVALRFEPDAAGTGVSVVVDGNHNGVRTIEIESGVDREVQPPQRLEGLFPGVAIARAPDDPGPALQIGGTNLLSFTPSGTSSSGTIYLLGRGGARFAVRVLGATGRVRVLRFDTSAREWRDAW